MNISEIDKDFVNIINLLNENGFNSFASCDGVLENHSASDSDPRMLAYIAFLESPQIIDLMTAFLRDKDAFTVVISNSTNKQPYYLYDNLISGNHFSIYFNNKNGDYTSYFQKIISGVIDGSIKIEDNEKNIISELSDILEDDEKSDLHISVDFNSKYQPYMCKNGRTNVLRVSTKDNCDQDLDMDSLIEKLTEKYEINTKKDTTEEKFEEDKFAVSCMGLYGEIYFTDEHIEQVLEQIRYIKEIEHDLPFVNRQSSDDMYLDEEFLEEEEFKSCINNDHCDISE